MNDRASPENPCARAEYLLPDYWQGEVSSGDRVWLDQHLQSCAECAELAALWQELGQMPRGRTRRDAATALRCYACRPSGYILILSSALELWMAEVAPAFADRRCTRVSDGWLGVRMVAARHREPSARSGARNRSVARRGSRYEATGRAFHVAAAIG